MENDMIDHYATFPKSSVKEPRSNFMEKMYGVEDAKTTRTLNCLAAFGFGSNKQENIKECLYTLLSEDFFDRFARTKGIGKDTQKRLLTMLSVCIKDNTSKLVLAIGERYEEIKK